MPYYRVTGEIPRKRHIRFNRPDGGLYAEELMGEEGFSSDSSLLYHVHPPTAIVKSEAIATGQARPNWYPIIRCCPGTTAPANSPSAATWSSGGSLAGNEDVTISFVAADAESELYRNSIGDETVYLQSGSARFESVYGAIDASAGDYVVIPRGTIHRWIPAEPGTNALVIEARGHIRPPKRYLSDTGQFLEHAPYSERDLRGVAGPLLCDGADVPVIVRNRGGLTPAYLCLSPVRRCGLGRLPFIRMPLTSPILNRS